MSNPAWLARAVFYEIYPQSFHDTNADGIGDLEGVIAKLDYIQSLNADVIWLNPCFESPFQDAGYDVADFYKIAPRYGSNDDLKRLCDEAHRRGMRVILDLVAGHTSIEHPFFQESMRDPDGPYGNYYIWTDGWGAPTGDYRFISGYGPRDGYFMINFFYCQPALNYGFLDPDPALPWQLPVDHPDVVKVREELRQVMKYWLDLGCDGFRVDMASSLVRGDRASQGVKALWQDYRGWMEANYPDAVLIAEWFYPPDAIDAGFHVDFMGHNHQAGYTKLFRGETERIHNSPFKGYRSFFDADGLGDALEYMQNLSFNLSQTAGKGYSGIITGNHDIGRLKGGRSEAEYKTALAFLLPLPGVPTIYYGDEIGMDNVFGLGNKEGSYNRSAARTPMQWTADARAGFSQADPASFYLPLDPDPRRPNVAEQEKDPGSVLNFTRFLTRLRREHPALDPDAAFIVRYCQCNAAPVVYERSDGTARLLVAVNPTGKAVTAEFALPGVDSFNLLKSSGGVDLLAESGSTRLTMAPASYAIYEA